MDHSRQDAIAGELHTHLVQAASRLFYKEGIRSVGVDRIAAEAGIAKATLYRYFPTKDDLLFACLSARQEEVLASMRDLVGRAPQTPQDRVGALFLSLGHLAMQPGFRGCPFLLAMAEYPHDDRIRSVTRRHKDGVRELFIDAVGRERDHDGALGGLIALLYEGASAITAVEGGTRAITRALSHVDDLLRTTAGAHRGLS
ncbi:MAG: TetR/AcrR family transcriptional regulator [Rhizobium sp.]